MTKLGQYLENKSVNKAEISRKTGISKSRLSELSINASTKLRAEELYLIALAMDVKPCEMLEALYSELTISK